jgi:hypothetical protein
MKLIVAVSVSAMVTSGGVVLPTLSRHWLIVLSLNENWPAVQIQYKGISRLHAD